MDDVHILHDLVDSVLVVVHVLLQELEQVIQDTLILRRVDVAVDYHLANGNKQRVKVVIEFFITLQ